MPKDHETISSQSSQIVPPNNVAAEGAVLGAVLFDNNTFMNVRDILRTTDFYAPAHQAVFEVCQQLIDSGRVADGVTLREHFDREDRLKEIGGASFLTTLLEYAAFGPEVADYAKLIRDLAIRRELITIGSGVQNRAIRPEQNEDGASQIETAEKELFQLAERGTTHRGFNKFSVALTDAIEMAEAAYKRDGKIAGISTGLVDLDKKLGGMHRSDLIILAGRPAMGKTSLATNIAFNAARDYRFETQDDGSKKTVEGAIVGFFSLEMSNDQLATRIISEQAEISSHKIRQGDISAPEFDKIREASQNIQHLPLFIDDQGGVTIGQLSARARRLHRTAGLDLLIIDYLQLLSSNNVRSSDSRVQEITQITMALKALAKELNIPILALSQLSRQVEQREDKRPQLADLRESGSIEQDADVVLFVYRESYYLEREEPKNDKERDSDSNDKWIEWADRMDRVNGLAEIIIGKQRHGPIGTAELAFDPQYTRFGNLTRGEEEDYAGI